MRGLWEIFLIITIVLLTTPTMADSFDYEGDTYVDNGYSGGYLDVSYTDEIEVEMSAGGGGGGDGDSIDCSILGWDGGPGAQARFKFDVSEYDQVNYTVGEGGTKGMDGEVGSVSGGNGYDGGDKGYSSGAGGGSTALGFPSGIIIAESGAGGGGGGGHHDTYGCDYQKGGNGGGERGGKGGDNDNGEPGENVFYSENGLEILDNTTASNGGQGNQYDDTDSPDKEDGGNGEISVTATKWNPPPPKTSNPFPTKTFDDSPVTDSNTNLSMDVTHEDFSIEIDVDFYFSDNESSVDNMVYSETINGGGTVTTDEIGPLDDGETYYWRAEACASDSCNKSGVWEFDIRYGPKKVELINPENGDNLSRENPELEVRPHHYDGKKMNVTFYLKENSETDYSQVGLKEAADGEIAAQDVSNETDSGRKYDWYVESCDSEGNCLDTKNEGWSFKLNEPPEKINQPENPKDGETVSGGEVELEVKIPEDEKADEVTVSFFNNETGDKIGSSTGSSGEIVSEVWSDIERGEVHEWHVEVDDGYDKTTSENWEFSVNNLPVITEEYPEDETINADNPTQLAVMAEDEETDNLKVYFFSGSSPNGDFIDSEPISESGESRIEWEETEIGNDYNWYVKVEDNYENKTSKNFEFRKVVGLTYRPKTDIQYMYTSVISSPGSTSQVFYEIENRLNLDKEINASIKGINAEFVSNSQEWNKFELESKESKRFQIVIKPEGTGKKNLTVITEDIDTGLSHRDDIPVFVRKSPAVDELKEVPGIGDIQVFILVLSAFYLYSARL